MLGGLLDTVGSGSVCYDGVRARLQSAPWCLTETARWISCAV